MRPWAGTALRRLALAARLGAMFFAIAGSRFSAAIASERAATGNVAQSENKTLGKREELRSGFRVESMIKKSWRTVMAHDDRRPDVLHIDQPSPKGATPRQGAMELGCRRGAHFGDGSRILWNRRLRERAEDRQPARGYRLACSCNRGRAACTPNNDGPACAAGGGRNHRPRRLLVTRRAVTSP